MKWFLGLLVLVSCSTLKTKPIHKVENVIYTEKSRIEVEMKIESILYNNFIKYRKEYWTGKLEYIVTFSNPSWLYCGDYKSDSYHFALYAIYMIPYKNGLNVFLEPRKLTTNEGGWFGRPIECHSNGTFENLFKDL